MFVDRALFWLQFDEFLAVPDPTDLLFHLIAEE